MKPWATERRVLAVPVLGERGGGVGRVSELLWDALSDTWPGEVSLVSLLKNGHASPTAHEKLRFGVELAGRQLLTRPRFILFAHLGLARADQFVPSALRTPYAVFLHGIEAWRPLGSGEQGLLRDAALRIANSQFTADAVAAANPGLGRIEVCPLALPKRQPARMAIAAQQPPRRHTVLVVGRLAAAERYKGHDQLIQAWPTVHSHVPNASLVIVGEGDDRPRLQQLAAAVGAGESIRFAGFLTRDELEAEYAGASVFALPSRAEGFGLVYLEAMMHGLPVIGSTVDAASEVVEHERTGVLVDPDDTERLGREIIALLVSPDRRAALGEAGRQRVLQRFQYQRFRTDLVALLDAAFGVDGAVA